VRLIALRHAAVADDNESMDVSVALRSEAQVGLSARIREGHCSNAGGLNAI
jgi:hypothetical protein